MKFDFLIIGSGIAGSSLALELMSRGASVALIDHRDPNSASSAAAGLVNPVVPKRVVLTWECDRVFPNIAAYYSQWELLLNQKFYFPMDMYQIHSSEEEKKMWYTKAQEGSISKYIEPETGHLPSNFEAPFGYSKINFCGRLNTLAFTEAVGNHIDQHGHRIAQFLDYQSLQQDALGNWQYGNIAAEHLVFCEGNGLLNNPWFKHLPLIPVAGDIAKFQALEPNYTVLLKKKQWLIPDGDASYLAGSNFVRNEKELSPQQGAEDIAISVREWARIGKMLSHTRGYRPTVVDRRPLLGSHPTVKNMHIYNGLGTKGCSLITWLSPIFASYLLKGTELPFETLISRFSGPSGNQ